MYYFALYVLFCFIWLLVRGIYGFAHAYADGHTTGLVLAYVVHA